MFKQHDLDDAEKTYQKLTLAPDQKAIIESLAKVVCQKIDMSELSMRGFMSYALKDWQQETKTLTSEIASMTPQERVKAVSTAFQFLNKRLHKILRDDSHSGEIDEAIDASLNFYINTFSKR